MKKWFIREVFREIMKKKFLKITGMMVLFIALVGFWGYNKYITPDPEVQQQLSNQFGTDFFSFDNEKVVDNAETVNNVVDDIDKKIDIPIKESIPEKVTPSTPVNENSVAKQITQDDINNKYKPQFNYLQNVALGRLGTLYSAAYQEYMQSSKTGTLNRSKLIQKYIQAGSMLEANMDNQIYSILNAMKAELIANNLPTDLVNVYKSEYEKAKANKRSQLLGKVLN